MNDLKDPPPAGATQLISRADDARPLRDGDLQQVTREYLAQDEFVFLPDAVAPGVLSALVAEATALRSRVHRNYIPHFKKGGSVSHHALREHAPATIALYRSDALRELVSGLAGRPVQCCPERDAHAAALYYYTEAGDHIGFHYDRSHYRGSRYTVLLGLVDRSSARLVCELYHDLVERTPETRHLATSPGSLAIFNGDRLYHSVSPIGEGEDRVVLSLEYVTDPAMGPVRRLVSDIKDAMAYFGFKGVFGRR